MGQKITWKHWAAMGLALAALICLGDRVYNHRHSDKLQRSILQAPEFSFEDRSARNFSSAELKGKVWVVDFIFAHCAGSCPLLSQQMMLLQNEWKGNPDLKLVTFTVDPDKDTAEALKAYAESYHADPNQWFFLTGPKKGLYQVIREGFKATAEPDPSGGTGFDFIHSTRLMLVDGKGTVRGLYDGENDADLKKLHQDVKFLMSSRSRS
jgi:protein SCO1